MTPSAFVSLAAGIVLAATAAKAQEAPRQLHFSASEQQLWQLTMQRSGLPPQPADLLARLDAAVPAADAKPLQAFWSAQRCRFALQADDDAAYQTARTALKTLEALADPGEFAGSAAGYKCQQISKFSSGESAETRQLSFLAYHSLTATDTAALHAWVSLDYAYDALAAGYPDSAATALSQVLSIARQNQLKALQAEALALQAETQLAQEQYLQALRSLDQAGQLAPSAPLQLRLQTLRGELLVASGRWPEAAALYQSLWQQAPSADQQLRAGLALTDIYLQQQDARAALTLSEQLQHHPATDRVLKAQSRLRHATVLLANQRVSEAIALFTDAGGWLAAKQLAIYLPEQQRFARLLAQQGQHQAALDAMQQSLQLQRQLDAQQASRQARLSSTLLIAEQRSRELKLASLRQALSHSQAQLQESRRRQQWLSIGCAALALLLALCIAKPLWRRYRKHHPR